MDADTEVARITSANLHGSAAALRSLADRLEALANGEPEEFTTEDALAGHHALTYAMGAVGTAQRLRAADARREVRIRLV